MKKLFSRVGLCLLCVFSSAGLAAAATVTLAWSANSESDLAGYVVHYGTSSGQYISQVDVGRLTSFQFVEPNPSIRYYLAVTAYNTSGAQSSFSQEVSTTPAGRLILTSVTSSLSPPQPVGTRITFSATASGSAVPPQFKWFTYDGFAWTLRQDWSTSSTFSYTPTVANPNFGVLVWARTGTNNGPDNDDASASMAFPIVAARSMVAVTDLSANKTAPQSIGTKIMFTAAASGAADPEFKWWAFDGASWTIVQEWSTSNRLVWEPTAARSDYQVIVRARDPLNAAESDGASMSFPIIDTRSFPIIDTRIPGGGR